jgi:oligopeptide/dipeptide ABC transporter ATP-binding protein
MGNQKAVVVDRLTFDLKAGEVLAIVGESGCGKSTLALSLLQALPIPPALPVEGEAFFEGKNLLKLSPGEMRSIRGSKITMIFQDPSTSLNPVYKVGDQLSEVLEIHTDLDEDEIYEKVIHALDEVKLPNPEIIYQKYPHELSGGQRQRVMIAMAILPEPNILIADEPTTALDVTVQKEIIELLRELQDKRRMACLLITHDMGLVADMAQNVIVMYASEIVEMGSKLEVLRNPKHPYTQALIASLPRVGSPLTSIKGNVPSLGHYPKGCKFHPRCPFAWEKCHEHPPLIENENQKVRCWLYDPHDS